MVIKFTILTNVSTVLVNVLEFSQCLDDVDVFPCPGNDKFRALVQAVIKNL